MDANVVTVLNIIKNHSFSVRLTNEELTKILLDTYGIHPKFTRLILDDLLSKQYVSVLWNRFTIEDAGLNYLSANAQLTLLDDYNANRITKPLKSSLRKSIEMFAWIAGSLFAIAGLIDLYIKYFTHRLH